MNNWFTTKEIHKNVWAIAEFKHEEEVISYLVVGEEEALLIDTGMGIHNIYDEIRIITNKPIEVLNTHCHFDHIGNNYSFKKISIFDHSWSKSISKNGVSNGEFNEYISPSSFFNGIPKGFDHNKYFIKPFEVTNLLKDGDIIELKPFSFKVIHTPGHSPDSICLYEESLGWLFSGDTLYDGPIYLQLEESSVLDYKKSLEKILKLDYINSIFPGHNTFEFKKEYIQLISEALDLAQESTKKIDIKARTKILLK